MRAPTSSSAGRTSGIPASPSSEFAHCAPRQKEFSTFPKIEPEHFGYPEIPEFESTILLSPALGSSAAPITLDDTDSEESDTESEINVERITAPSSPRSTRNTNVRPSKPDTKQNLHSIPRAKYKSESKADAKNSGVLGWVAAHAKLESGHLVQREIKRNARMASKAKIKALSPSASAIEQLSESSSEPEDDAIISMQRPRRSNKKSEADFAQERRGEKIRSQVTCS